MINLKKSIPLSFALCASLSQASEQSIQSKTSSFGSLLASQQISLQNDSFKDSGSAAYLQLGFVTGEKAGIWVKVPESIPYFKAEYFRVLIGYGQNIADNPVEISSNVVYFHAATQSRATQVIPTQLSNAAQITPGPYWNDIPLRGENGSFLCARGGEYIGAALEFTHSGTPSVFRDDNGFSNVAHNLIMAIPGGWNYSASYGLTSDWILRVVGSPATEAECKN